MSRIADIYAKEVLNNFRKLYANWLPAEHVELGDYGVLRHRIFEHRGNVLDLGITFGIAHDPTSSHEQFETAGRTEVNFFAKGSGSVTGAATVNAGFEIKFSHRDAVFFNAADCYHDRIKDENKLGGDLRKLRKAGKWHKSWVIVAELVRAGSTTVAVSGGDSSSVVLEAKAKVPNVELADASIGLRMVKSKDIGYIVVSEQGLIPLIGLGELHWLSQTRGWRYRRKIR
jgi:hypothetical protein